MKINLLNFSLKELQDFFVAKGEKAYCATQLVQWIHQKGVSDFSLMTNLKLSFRRYLIANCEVRRPEIFASQLSQDGSQKWLLKLDDDNLIEMVYIPEGDRGTLCVSSQVGCPLNCAFCATGKAGFKRNLTLAEIIGQLWLARHRIEMARPPFLGSTDSTAGMTRAIAKNHITNIVFMGMGEPLLNLKVVLDASELMLDDLAYGLSKYRVTVSTAGLIPEMQSLSAKSKVSLAISLHAGDDKLRSSLMPINKKYPLCELITAAKQYFKASSKRVVTFEYIMLADLNDSDADAKKLVRLLKNVPCKVNLIPYNAVGTQNPELCKYRPSAPQRIDSFRRILLDADINTITRKSRGQDIAAACGQLAGK